ncbi:MAG: YidC/Oxa1 family membrane protein insertase [Fimbriimonas sp.]
MSKPNPKGNFLQTFLIITTLWMGYVLFFQGPKGPEVVQTPEQIFAELVKQNQQLMDSTIVRTANAYDHKLQEQLKAKTITQDKLDEQQLAAAVLVADTQRKAALVRNDTNRLRLSYTTLKNYKKAFENTPLWTKQVDVPDDKRSESTAWTPKELHERTYEELNKRNHDELVYGALPGFAIIDFLVGLTGHQQAFSYAFACFLLALIVRTLIFPLAQKQLMFSRQMGQLVPLTNEVRAKYKDDPQQQQVKVMEIYKEYGINPLAGCFPALLQMPLFLTVYQFMLHYQFAFQKGTFLWINPSVSQMTGGWTAPNLGELDYPLILIYGVTMLASTLLAPISDPSQAKQQRMMSIGMSIMFTAFMFFWPLPSAFVLYWTFTNLLSMAQSLRAYKLPMPPLQKVNAAGGGVYPKSAVGGKWMKMMEEFQKQAAEQQAADPKNGGAKPGTGQVISNGEVKTGTPAKHKPKKRK